jgi:cysteine desulfurase
MRTELSIRTYLDWNATAPLRAEARAAMLAGLDLPGNASSVHGEGRRARAAVETAREQVAALLNAAPADLVFTSGATEANNTILSADWDTIYVADIEHESVLAPVAASQARIVKLPVGADGVVRSLR